MPAAPAPFLPRAFAPAPAFAPAAFAPAAAYHAPAAAYHAGAEGAARIVAQDADIAPDGSYHYAYQTENGISGSEAGTPKLLGPQQGGESVQGNFAVSNFFICLISMEKNVEMQIIISNMDCVC